MIKKDTFYLDECIRLSCDYLSIDIKTVISKKYPNQKKHAPNRQVIMYIAWHLLNPKGDSFIKELGTDFSLSEIGEAIGGKDHSTVVHAIKTTNNYRDVYPEFNRTVYLLLDYVKDNLLNKKIVEIYNSPTMRITVVDNFTNIFDKANCQNAIMHSCSINEFIKAYEAYNLSNQATDKGFEG